MAVVLSRTETMTSFNHVDLDEAHTPSSDYSFAQANMLSSNGGMFSSYCQTEPGSAWDTTVEGTQNFATEFSDHGDLYIAETEDFVPFSHNTPRLDQASAAEDLHSKWTAAAAADFKAPKAEPMRRMTSRSSVGSHKHRTIKATSSKKTRPRVNSSLSATTASAASRFANLDVASTGNTSSLFGHASLGSGRMMDPQQFLAQEDLDTLSVSSHMSAQAYNAGMMGLTSDGLPYSSDMGFAVAQHVNPSATQIFDPHMTGNSPHSWDSLSSGSRNSSPGLPDDTWSAGAFVASPTDTHSSSPDFPDQSPRVNRKLDGSQAVSSQDLYGNAMNSVCDDSFSLPPPFNQRRLSGDGEAARDHPLYKSAVPGPDGLFHCPWEGSSNCNHKPEKLKCNYDKFVDSHLKPYRCKAESCENTRFSSTACLLRHEREAHAMHGHGDKPYLCTYEGCERSNPGCGFPRQWNLKDHMRRVHNDNGSSTQVAAAATTAAATASSPPASGNSTKGRKRKNKDSAERSCSRKSSTKSSQTAEVPAPKAVEAPSNPEIEQWYEHQKMLQSIVQGLTQPEDANVLMQIKDAQDYLTAMGRISRETISANKAELLQGNYRHSWQRSG